MQTLCITNYKDRIDCQSVHIDSPTAGDFEKNKLQYIQVTTPMTITTNY